MATEKEILDKIVAVVANFATSRDATNKFVHHITNLPFTTAPIRGIESFHVQPIRHTQLSGFGVLGQRQVEWFVDVLLGQAPFGIEADRETFLAQDIAKIVDGLEAATGWPSGTQAVFFVDSRVDKSNALWWVVTLNFRIIYTGPSAA